MNCDTVITSFVYSKSDGAFLTCSLLGPHRGIWGDAASLQTLLRESFTHRGKEGGFLFELMDFMVLMAFGWVLGGFLDTRERSIDALVTVVM